MIDFWINNTGACATIFHQSKTEIKEIQRLPAERLFFNSHQLHRMRLDHVKMMLKQLAPFGPCKITIEREDKQGQEFVKNIRIVEKL